MSYDDNLYVYIYIYIYIFVIITFMYIILSLKDCMNDYTFYL